MTVGCQTQKFRASVDFLNLFDSKDHDIDYYYHTSRLPGEPAGGVNDLHFHPVEPLNVRFNLAWMYRATPGVCTVECAGYSGRSVRLFPTRQGVRSRPMLWVPTVSFVAIVPSLPAC